MDIILFTWLGNRCQKSVVVGLFCQLLVEYESSVDVAHSIVIHLFRSTSMIHSTSIRKCLTQTLNWSATTVVAFIWKIYYSRHFSQDQDQDVRPQDQDTKNVPRSQDKIVLRVDFPSLSSRSSVMWPWRLVEQRGMTCKDLMECEGWYGRSLVVPRGCQ